MSLPVRLPTLEEFSNENFLVRDDVLYFDPTDGTLNISTKFGGGRTRKGEAKVKFQPRRSTIGNNEATVLSAYGQVAKTPQDAKILDDIKTSLKGKGPYSLDKDSYREFIHRTAMYLRQLVGMRKADLILTCESKSPLADDLAAELARLMGGRVDTIYKAISKNHELDTIQILKDDPRITGGIVKNLEGVIRKAIGAGYFEMKTIQPQYRKFIDNWLEVSADLAAELDNKHVILVDDYFTTGTTLLEAVRSLHRFNVASVFPMTLLK